MRHFCGVRTKGRNAKSMDTMWCLVRDIEEAQPFYVVVAVCSLPRTLRINIISIDCNGSI